MKKNNLFTSLGMTLLLLIACESENDIVTETVNSVTIDQIKSLGFDTNGIYKSEMAGQHGFVVEGDIFLDKKMIDNMLDNVLDSQQKHYVAPNLLPRDRAITIDVYFDAAFSTTMESAFYDAINRYNELGINLTFKRTFNQRNSDIAILSENIPNAPNGSIVLGRSAGFPRFGRPATPIVLNSRVYGGTNVGADAATVVAHEIGHAIGFRHTDWDDRSYSCGGNYDNEGRSGALYVPGTPRGPEAGSWMLACSAGTDRPFTTADKNALKFVY